MISSIKELALAGIEYRDNFDNEGTRMNFIEEGEISTSAIESFLESIKNNDSPLALELSAKLKDFRAEIDSIFTKTSRNEVTQDELNQFIDRVSEATGRRYEKVSFDRYEEREIRPRVLGSGGQVTVHNGELTLPVGINATEALPEDYLADFDTQVSPEMLDLLNRLDYDPARIYWWVHEDVRFMPYYGAMHGAEQTMISRTGNDVDTAILLVALLRAAGFPARYVYGEAYATRDEVLIYWGLLMCRVLFVFYGARTFQRSLTE
jgi:hypothetical protein